MRLLFVTLVVAVGVVTCVPLNPTELILQDLQRAEIGVRNDPLELMILDLLELLRGILLTGYGSVPVLDPFEWDYLHLDQAVLDNLGLNLNLANSYLTISDVFAVGLSTFEITELSLRMTSLLPMRYTLYVDALIPTLDVGAESYDLQLSVLGYNLFGKGSAKFRLIDPRLTATIVVAPSLLGGISISLTNTHIVIGLRGFESNITGLFHDEGASDFVNVLLRLLIPDLVEFYEDEITAAVGPIVQDIANSILQDIDLGGIFPFNEVEHLRSGSLKY